MGGVFLVPGGGVCLVAGVGVVAWSRGGWLPGPGGEVVAWSGGGVLRRPPLLTESQTRVKT